MKVYVTKTSMEIDPGEVLVEGRVGLECEFVFSAEWDGLAKTAAFVGPAGSGIAVPIFEDRCIIPPEVFTGAAGAYLTVSVTGRAEDGTVVIPTIYGRAGKIERSAAGENLPEVHWEPTPDFGAQVMNAAQQALTNAETAAHSASTSAMAAEEAALSAREAQSSAETAEEAAAQAALSATAAQTAANSARADAGTAAAAATTAAGKANDAAGSASAAATTAQNAVIAAYDARATANNAKAAADTVLRAYQSGELKGEPGDPGQPGEPGPAPTVEEIRAVFEPELRELNEDLVAVDRRLDRIEEGADKVDIFTLENATEGYYVSSSGVLTPNKDVGVTDYIDLSGFIGDITYYFATALTHQGAFYNSEKTFISGFYLSGIGEHSIAIPTNARYVRLDYVLSVKDEYYCYATNPFLQKIDTVKINGTALEKVDGTVDIPLAKTGGDAGLVKVSYSQGFHVDAAGQLAAYNENPFIDNRFINRPLSLEHLDYAVKAAMTDGKGADWTTDEQKAAWARLGLFEDLKSQITFGAKFAGKFQLVTVNQTTFMRIGNLIFLNIACQCLEAISYTDLDYLYQIPPAYAPRYNSVGLAYNSSAKISGFCYVRGGSGQIVVKTAGAYGLNHEIDIAMFWTI